MATHEKGDHHRHAKNEIQRRPKHAHQLNQPKGTTNVLAIRAFERGDLSLFLCECSHQAGAREVLLRLARRFRRTWPGCVRNGDGCGCRGYCTSTEAIGKGTKAKSVSLGLMRSRKEARTPRTRMVFALYMIAGPSSIRTAARSLVMRAMMSPVRCSGSKRRIAFPDGETGRCADRTQSRAKCR